MKFGIGQPVLRSEDPKFLTGRGRYVDDITLVQQAYGYVLRSVYAHARIIAIDIEPAASAPGVIRILTGADYEAAGLGEIACDTMNPMLIDGPTVEKSYPALKKDAVKCIGAAVAFVIAETLDQARDAAELIEVVYDVLPAVTSVLQAKESGAPVVWEGCDDNRSFTFKIGNGPGVEDALAKAQHVTTATISNNRITTNAIEPRASIGAYDPAEDRYTLYSSNQTPHGVRHEIAHSIFHIPENSLRVIAPDVGGGFGLKGGFYGEDVLVLWAAREIGRPVKWVGDRLESFLSDCHARDVVADCRMAFDGDGKVTGLQVDAAYNVGAYLAPSAGISPMFFTMLLSGVYAIPAISVTTDCYFTNQQATAPYRGAGRPEAAYVLERLFDMAARELKLDPVDIRRRNLVKADQMPYQTALAHKYDCGDFEAVMDKALAESDWNGFEERRQHSEEKGYIRGRGLAVYMESAAPFNERMEIRFDPSGSVSVVAGTHSHGQGHATVYAQMVSEFLGVPFESVRLIQGDTDKVSIGRGTVGSRSMTVGGSALKFAADAVIEKGKKIAAHLLETGESDIEFSAGNFTVAGTDRRIDIVEVAKLSYTPMNWPTELGIGLEGVGDFSAGMGNYPNGAQVAEIEIDPATGTVRLDRLLIVDDVGTVINPLLLKGQLHGGVAQGIGQALFENLIFDESGQLLTASFMDYVMPRADNFPDFETVNLAVPTPSNPLGVKGAGETGTVGAPPALINAIVDALSPNGVTDIDMPATPEKIWRALN